MSFIINRIEKSFNVSIPYTDTITDEVIKKMDPKDRADLIKHHAQLNVEYTVLCSKITQEFKSNQHAEFKEKIEEALRIAELLEIIYSSYLNIPREYERLQQEKIIFNSWLTQEARKNSLPAQKSRIYSSKAIREKTSDYNFYRFLVVRARRLLLTIAPVTHPLSSYRHVIAEGDKFIGPFFAKVTLFYFIPRLSNNLFMTLKHTISNPYMSEQEKILRWQTRFYIQLKARWPDVSNDIPWMIANSVSYFVLTGALAPYGIILSISMQLYDVLQTSIQYYIKIIKQLRPQLETYRQLLTKITNSNSPEYQQLKSYIDHFEQYIKYETNRLIVSLINVSALLIAIILAAPLFAFSPAFAIAGGALAVATTITSFIVQKNLPKQQNNLHNLLLNDSIKTPSTRTEAPTTPVSRDSSANTAALLIQANFFTQPTSEDGKKDEQTVESTSVQAKAARPSLSLSTLSDDSNALAKITESNSSEGLSDNNSPYTGTTSPL